MPRIAVAAAVAFVLFDIPRFLVFRMSRVRAAYAKVEAQRKQRQEDRDLQRSIKI